jgi:hypothetical protein
MLTGMGRRSAIMHISVPYLALLSGLTAPQEVRGNELGLANYYRAKGLRLVITVDVTNGLDRAREDPVLDSLGRSITDSAVPRLYREYVLALDSILHPDYLGLAAETNLIRLAAPDSGTESARPVLVVEGGWTSTSIGAIASSPAKQARWDEVFARPFAP